jgi:hypothetical protein
MLTTGPEDGNMLTPHTLTGWLGDIVGRRHNVMDGLSTPCLGDSKWQVTGKDKLTLQKQNKTRQKEAKLQQLDHTLWTTC